MSLFGLTLKNGWKLQVAMLLAATCFGAPSFGQDALLSSQEGEIILQPEETPVFEVAPLDPSYEKKKQTARKRKRQEEEALRALNDALIVSNKTRDELEVSVTALDEDKTALVDQLIATARSIQQTEDAVLKSQSRLEKLSKDEADIKKSLVSRRAVLSEVLGALQRMGKNPPPAIVVSASDTLSAVRSAILLGSVLPELREEANALVQDLASLADIIDKTKTEWAKRVDQERLLSQEQVRLDLLIKENQRLKATSDQKLAVETTRNQTLAREATNLRDLITSISREIDGVDLAARSAQTSAERDVAKKVAAFKAARQQALADITELRAVELPPTNEPEIPVEPSETGVVLAYNSEADGNPDVLPDIEREVIDYGALLDQQNAVNPSVSFENFRGKLNQPVRGVLLRSFGEADGLGGASKGMTFETRAQAPVIAPAAGRVVFSGKFSGFDQLLIIDVGSGYHMVLGGMSKINVNVGDTLKAGEPVASMGGKRLRRLAGVSTDAAALLANNFSTGQTQPILYVELRKNGKSVNSSPWWVKS